MHNENIIKDSISFLNNMMDLESFDQLTDIQKEYFSANREHLIISLNNKTSHHLSNNLINDIQTCLNRTRNYMNL